MPLILSTEGVILSKNLSGENHLRLEILSPQRGIFSCFKRFSRHSKSAYTPDLWDQLSLQLTVSKNGNALFVQECHLIDSFFNIARHYESFCYACEWSALISKNMIHSDRFDLTYHLFLEALSSWNKSLRPEIIFFKSLYRFMRQEGYPAKEQWIASLSQQDLSIIAILLQQPTASIHLASEQIMPIIQKFKHWIRYNTDIMIE